MKTLKSITLLGALIALSTFAALAVDPLIPLSAKLTGNKGLVINGTNAITFKIYPTAEGGTPSWSELQTVNVNQGVLSTQLGSVASLAGADLDGDVWLGISVGGDAEMKPRVRIPGQRSGLPRGGIIMWSGDQVPSGWALCDGTKGTPNLSGRFIVAAGTNLETKTAYPIGQTGGKETHNHGGKTQPHTLTIPEMPSHHHDYTYFPGVFRNIRFTDGPYNASQHDETKYETTSQGGDQPHDHPLNADSNLPPYYALAFIMKL